MSTTGGACSASKGGVIQNEDFSCHDLTPRSFYGTQFNQVDLRRVLADGVDFRLAAFRRCSMEAASLRGAQLDQADLRGMNLQMADLTEARLSHAYLAHALLKGAMLGQAQLPAADLTQARLVGADLSRACLRRAILQRAHLMHADLSSADLSFADLRGANLQKADLSHATLTGADLSGADLRGAILIQAACDRVRLQGTQLEGAILDAGTRGAAALRRAQKRQKTPFPLRFWHWLWTLRGRPFGDWLFLGLVFAGPLLLIGGLLQMVLLAVVWEPFDSLRPLIGISWGLQLSALAGIGVPLVGWAALPVLKQAVVVLYQDILRPLVPLISAGPAAEREGESGE
jgi:uncharacterized protein YjbI with pentapeptide repeats